MKALAICYLGIEDICAIEVKELINAKPRIGNSVVEFSAKREDIARFCYQAQSVAKVLEVMAKTRVADDLNKTLASLKKAVAKSDLSKWLKDRTFKVRCKRIGAQDYHGQDIAPEVGEYIIDQTKAKVSMTNPDIIVYVYIYEKDCYIGIDYSGFDLSKRDYKVFTHPNSLNSTIGYALYRICGSNSICDPFCGSGAIPIEAALHMEGKSPHHFKKDKFAFHRFLKIDLEKIEQKKMKGTVLASDQLLKFVKATKSNAKLAGISFHVTRMDLEWLDTKYDKHSVDIVTQPPVASRIHDAKYIDKLYKELLYQADYVAKKKMVLCAQSFPELRMEKFNVVEQREIWQGKQKFEVMILSR